MPNINCEGTNEHNYFARCVLRDDVTTKTQIVLLIIMVMMLGITGFCIKNLIALKRAKELKKTKGITILNVVILVFALVRSLFYLDAFLQILDTGYALYVYLIIQNISIVIFNSLYALGAYYWFKMLLITSIQKEKLRKKILWIITIGIEVVNALALIVPTWGYIRFPIQDNSCLLEHPIEGCSGTFQKDYDKMSIIFVIVSSFSSGAFFCVTALFVSIQLKNIRWLPKEIYIKKLSIACIIITTVRIIQDFIQVVDGDLLGTMKMESQKANNLAWPIYGFVYLFTIDILATSLFVKIFEPTGTRQDVVTLKASVVINTNDPNLDSDKEVSEDAERVSEDAEKPSYKLITGKHGTVNSSDLEKSNPLSDSSITQ